MTTVSLLVIVIAVGGIAVYSYLDLTRGIHRSNIAMPTGQPVPAVVAPTVGPAASALAPVTPTAAGVPQNDGSTNTLIMGLDSRLDENGNPLPAATYNALHAGNQDGGGYNSNVLMLIHIPAGGRHAVGISIPRDDWAPLVGAPDGQSMGKIKQAYGFELAQDLRQLHATEPNLTAAQAYQQARDAGRKEEVDTVSQFLGGVPINHFIEVTMAAFYELAVAVQPITVCLNEATSDHYSGADFKAGYQQLSAAQAVAFVRQRRDTSNSKVQLTDLDRERRQQAFITSLAFQLRHASVFTNFGLLRTLIDTAKQNIAIDSGLDLLSFASDADRFAGGGITFHTLPITAFGTKDGQDVNLVDPARIQALTAQLIAASNASPTAAAAAAAAAKAAPTPPHSSTSGPKPTTASRLPTSTRPSNVYTNPFQPLTSGQIPCVN
ncbi:MAG: LCP family protein [Nakamurella sp.]